MARIDRPSSTSQRNMSRTVAASGSWTTDWRVARLVRFPYGAVPTAALDGRAPVGLEPCAPESLRRPDACRAQAEGGGEPLEASRPRSADTAARP
jgi:hypothetical protein